MSRKVQENTTYARSDKSANIANVVKLRNNLSVVEEYAPGNILEIHFMFGSLATVSNGINFNTYLLSRKSIVIAKCAHHVIPVLSNRIPRQKSIHVDESWWQVTKATM